MLSHGVSTKLVSQALLILATLAMLIGGVVLLLRDSSSGGVEIVLPMATVAATVEVEVYISGAVRRPGVYGVNDGDRLVQVIEAAGGSTEDADLTAVNLAARVKDEDHWHIPRVGEVLPPASAQRAGQAGKIDINSATAEQLEGLPGIGEVKAQAIIRYRDSNGPFPSVDGLAARPRII